MKTGPDWNDLAYFSAIARTGGLARAAETVGVSVATLSRRMKAFEVSMGRRLFLHGANGYALTSDGRALAGRIGAMEAAARSIADWRAAAGGPAPVRISAGTWTAHDLAGRISRFWNADAIWLPEFIHSDQDMDIARRQVDIGIRNRRADQAWLAGRRLGSVSYAVYGRGPDVTGWIGAAEGAASTPHLAAALARAGMGRTVLPTFAGDRLADLTRLSEPIEALQSEQWLVSHHDARADPPIRAAIDALGAYLEHRDDG